MSTILKNTLNNIVRNKWLSMATIIVATIVFLAASFFIGLSVLAQRAVKISQTKAQLQIYFQIDTPEGEISKIKDILENTEGIEGISYVSQDEALELYIDYYSDDPELIDSVSADWLPASLEVRAKSLDYLVEISDIVKEEQKINSYIEEVVYHKDIVNQLKSISKGINIGAIFITLVFSVITLSLVFITISFNISSHRREIEIMHVIGTNDSKIKVPFILEGVFYTTLGAFIAATLLIIPIILIINDSNTSNIHYVFTDLLNELNLNFLKNNIFISVLGFYFIHIISGVFIGFISSSFSVVRNLNLK